RLLRQRFIRTGAGIEGVSPLGTSSQESTQTIVRLNPAVFANRPLQRGSRGNEKAEKFSSCDGVLGVSLRSKIICAGCAAGPLGAKIGRRRHGPAVGALAARARRRPGNTRCQGGRRLGSWYFGRFGLPLLVDCADKRPGALGSTLMAVALDARMSQNRTIHCPAVRPNRVRRRA